MKRAILVAVAYVVCQIAAAQQPAGVTPVITGPAVQVTPDPTAGWGTLTFQAASVGLLIYIVTRLAPSLLREARAEREQRDKLFADAMEKQTESLKAATKEQTESLTKALDRVCHAGTAMLPPARR